MAYQRNTASQPADDASRPVRYINAYLANNGGGKSKVGSISIRMTTKNERELEEYFSTELGNDEVLINEFLNGNIILESQEAGGKQSASFVLPKVQRVVTGVPTPAPAATDAPAADADIPF